MGAGSIRPGHPTGTERTAGRLSTLPRVGAPLADQLAGFEAISLDELDERVSLQRRVDNKYLLSGDELGSLLGQLAADHQVLEIEERRCFRYESIYFDTPSLTCYHDHVDDRRPRAKVRSRLYVEAQSANFEVKLKLEDGETDKHHLDCGRGDHGSIPSAARSFLEETLEAAGTRIDIPSLEPALRTRFERFTLAADDGSARVTCDTALRLSLPEGSSLRLAGERVVLEAKSAGGDARCDRLLREAGIRSISFSKYRAGIALLAGPRPDREADQMSACFARE
jgi:hypothetical protein